MKLRARDEQVRSKLAADGSLFDGYHPRTEEVHRDNATELRTVIQAHGQPNEELVGRDGAEAAWLIAQHSIGKPEFMRSCRTLLVEESSLGRVPRWLFAYIEDRIRVFEGSPQRFGKQIDYRPEGPEAFKLESPLEVDARRKDVGLLALVRRRMRTLRSGAPTAGSPNEA